MRLKNKVAIVTGGAKRIGAQIALELASRGCHVAITYRTSVREAQKTVQAIRRKKVKGLALAVDQRSHVQVHKAVEAVRAKWGRIDILVNNASSFQPVPWATVTPAQFEEAIATNLTGPWTFAQAVAPYLKRQSVGKIVNIVDIAVYSPWTDYLPYCVAKGGLVTLTRGLAKALAPKVQVNAVAPGPILFPANSSSRERKRAIARTLLKRVGSPQDVVQAVLFFVEGTDFVTGTVLPVDGGRLLA